MEEVSKDLKDERNVDDVASGFKFDERNETEQENSEQEILVEVEGLRIQDYYKRQKKGSEKYDKQVVVISILCSLEYGDNKGKLDDYVVMVFQAICKEEKGCEKNCLDEINRDSSEEEANIPAWGGVLPTGDPWCPSRVVWPVKSLGR